MGANLQRLRSSSPETPQPQARNTDSRDHCRNQNPFQDILDDETVLPVNNLRARNEPDEDSQNNNPNTATSAGQGENDKEEGTVNHSSDSNGSSAREVTWSERPPRRG